jgi:pSer/pThr/pTyr-binding forkhead associated (FHA) protein
MGQTDFPTWFGLGSYGGLGFTLFAAATVAFYALRLRRGTPRQLARASLVCLICCCLMFAPIWWLQERFNLLGPTLASAEVAIWLAWTALVGWSLPLGTIIGYLILAAPQPLTGVVPVPAQARGSAVSSRPSALDDPARQIEPLGAGRAWGQLVPIDGPFAQRALPLSRQMTLLGREADCEIVVPDDQASRHHAELRWDHGHIHLVDRSSLNGTRVNGQWVHGQVPLRDGDVVEIGSQRYRFEQLVPRGRTPSTPVAGADEETRKVASPTRGAIMPPPMAVLTLALITSSGAEPGKAWALDGPLLTIGRDAACAICLPDSSVSRRHAQIVHQASGFYAQDLDSQNGTLLNGQPLLSPTLLRAGDVLQVGELMLRCQSASDPAEGEPPAPLPSVAGLSNADAAEPAGRVARALPNTHMLLSPQPRPADRPYLAPPRLIPSQAPQPEEGTRNTEVTKRTQRDTEW